MKRSRSPTDYSLNLNKRQLPTELEFVIFQFCHMHDLGAFSHVSTSAASLIARYLKQTRTLHVSENTHAGLAVKHCRNLHTLYLPTSKINRLFLPRLLAANKHCFQNLQEYETISVLALSILSECLNLRTLALDSGKIAVMERMDCDKQSIVRKILMRCYLLDALQFRSVDNAFSLVMATPGLMSRLRSLSFETLELNAQQITQLAAVSSSLTHFSLIVHAENQEKMAEISKAIHTITTLQSLDLKMDESHIHYPRFAVPSFLKKCRLGVNIYPAIASASLESLECHITKFVLEPLMIAATTAKSIVLHSEWLRPREVDYDIVFPTVVTDHNEIIFRTYRNLTMLNIQACLIPVKLASYISCAFPALEKLSLSIIGSQEETQSVLAAILTQLPNLESLEFGWKQREAMELENFTQTPALHTSLHHPRLKDMTLTGIWELARLLKQIDHFPALEKLALKECKNLSTPLHLSRPFPRLSHFHISDTKVVSVIPTQPMPSVTHLDLLDIRDLANESLMEFVKCFPNVKILALRSLHNISHEIVPLLATWLPATTTTLKLLYPPDVSDIVNINKELLLDCIEFCSQLTLVEIPDAWSNNVSLINAIKKRCPRRCRVIFEDDDECIWTVEDET